MSRRILDGWSHHASAPTRSRIVPDGCRDVIVEVAPAQAPRWFISPLDDAVRDVDLKPGVFVRGLRLRPGVQLDQAQLLPSLQARHWSHEEVVERIHECTHVCPSVADALDGLSAAASVGEAARRLGVSTRSLERLLARATGRSPVFWLQLARLRRAARDVGDGHALVEVAHRYAFADQAHMNRQFRRWLGVTPAGLRDATALQAALAQSGFG